MKKYILCLILLLSLYGCSSQSPSIDQYDKINTSDALIAESSTIENTDGIASYGQKSANNPDSPSENTEINKKIIYNGNIEIETRDFSKTLQNINELINKYNGYIQSSSVYGSDNLYPSYDNNYIFERHASYTIRIPSENMEGFLNDSKSKDNIVSLTLDSNDVTDNYYDTKSRISSLEAQEKRLVELYEKANTIDEIISLENRISDIRYQIDSLTTTIKNYDLLTQYSTFNINIREIAIHQVQDDNVSEKIIDTFKLSWNNFNSNIIDFAIDTIYVLPYVVVFGVPICILMLYHNKKNKRKK